MADTYRSNKRGSADLEQDSYRNKKVKKDESPDEVDGKKYNPYLAHMYDGDTEGNGIKEEPAPNSPLAGFKRRQTTAKQAAVAEDSDVNAFTGEVHSQQYFKILQTRRDLPVHKQRYVLPVNVLPGRAADAPGTDRSSSTNTTRPRPSSSSARPVPAKRHRYPNMSSTMNYPTLTRSSLHAPSPVESQLCP